MILCLRVIRSVYTYFLMNSGGAVGQLLAQKLYFDSDFPFVSVGGERNAMSQIKVVAFASPKVYLLFD
jgi:hypothetical protein